MKKQTIVSLSIPFTAVPPGVMSVRRSANLAAEALSLDKKDAMRLQAMARLSGVGVRHGVVFDSSSDPDAASAPFYQCRPQGAPQAPTTAERMAVYAQEAPRLATKAARGVLEQEKLSPSAVTHLVVVSCTGFFSPGLDHALVRELCLSPSVRRVWVGFMGCHGALNGCSIADNFIRADPTAAVLVVCVELCSLHYQFTLDRDSLVSNFLFADGAAAVVVRPEATGRRSQLRFVDAASHYFPDSAEAMTWKVGDSGFHMTLDRSVPQLIADDLRRVVDTFLARNRLALPDIVGWAIHPGGPRILDASAEALGLDEHHVAVSREILRTHGNMSSPTVLFLVKELMARGVSGPIAALAFGPGLVAELALLQALGETTPRQDARKIRRRAAQRRPT